MSKITENAFNKIKKDKFEVSVHWLTQIVIGFSFGVNYFGRKYFCLEFPFVSIQFLLP